MEARLQSFIADTFRSVWDLELLLLLKTEPSRGFTAEALVTQLRASESVVAKGSACLVAAGLAVEDAGSTLRFAPASPDLETLVDATEDLYRSRPDAVRRTIAGRSAGELSAFADAFRLRGEKK